MNKLLLVVLFLPLMCFSQKWKESIQDKDKNWAFGEVHLVSGEVFESVLQLSVGLTEGTLKVKKGDQIVSLSPRQVDRFQYFDSAFNNTREFISVPCKFRKRTGSKNIFLELIYEGEKYSVFRRFLPVTKTGLALIPIPDYYLSALVWSYGILEMNMFVYPKGEFAYQVTKRVDFMDYQVKDKLDGRYIRYDLDSFVLKEIFEDRLKDMKKYCAKNRIDFSSEHGLVESIKFVQESSFQYNREETPKRLRN
jgi:hypothetical protein